MKKIYTLFAVSAAAALALVSCNTFEDDFNNDTPFDISKIEVRFDAGDFDNSPATKAVKTAWAKDDRVNLWFDDSFGGSPDMVLIYNGSTWAVDTDATVSGNSPANDGEAHTLKAIYEGWNDISKYSSSLYNSNSRNYISPSITIDGTTSYCTPAIYYSTLCENFEYTSYSLSGNVLTCKVKSWGTVEDLQIVVSGLPKEASHYGLKFIDDENDEVNYHSYIVYTGALLLSGEIQAGTQELAENAYAGGVPNGSGDGTYDVAFYYRRQKGYGLNNCPILLCDDAGNKWTYNVTFSQNANDLLTAGIIPFSKFTALP